MGRKKMDGSMMIAPRRRHADDLKLVERMCALLDESEGPLSLESLAQAFAQSPWQLYRLFRKHLGISPRDWQVSRREQRFREELRRGEGVAAATYGAGYGSSSRVYEQAAERLGMTPASYAKGGKGARIVWGSADSSLGPLLVAATEKGICFVALGDSVEGLEQALHAEFPAADLLVRDQEAVDVALELLVDYLKGQEPHLDLPLDIRATAFQRRVWNELAAIPYGETRSYAELAARLGLPKASRAVGRACGSNPVALILPCHRVLRGDGGLSGYRWGVARKKQLLKQEAAGLSGRSAE
ncbi:MAG TPA: methylated-DNA--[protein]-cysteine S-methyltransferase [Kiloniellales bacterium]|jgi:AraC family transcriptional regulator of adaptative response/methylated-DNA-[protein]-cysteine methyltransferase|nr:methylated-DNA--[protein]-cysteine S-methyltransferase [Kiloniellales bacterium]